ncbi:MAG: GNAT family N-acetyltransferase [Muribaculaceae bacterium]|nr:GNAT family N-acetyltransferase [Muribaculaceae bacterium]MDE6135022.1 GNAT family N-acetyltransferase [Muribaculaceae bacterium]
MISIELYESGCAAEWDELVDASRNGTFLHKRAYMDYHSDRFDDCSLLARDGRGRLVAALPAHRNGNVLASHRGLTYGGWIMTAKADMEAMMEIWASASAMARQMGFGEILYRPVPHIYHRYPAEEDIYALWRAGGVLDTVLVSSVVDLQAPLGFDMSYRQSVRKAAAKGVEVGPSSDFAGFWQLLSDNLMATHNAKPVHTLDEIMLLHDRFPDNIFLYTAQNEGELLAGVVVYDTHTVAHSQYASASPAGKQCRVMPMLYEHIMRDAASRGKRFFDFGTSCEDSGHVLNTGLIRQKASFGARAVAYQSYKIKL